MCSVHMLYSTMRRRIKPKGATDMETKYLSTMNLILPISSTGSGRIRIPSQEHLIHRLSCSPLLIFTRVKILSVKMKCFFLRSVLKQKGIRISERLSGMAGSSTYSDFVAATTSLIGKDSLDSLPDFWELWASLIISIGRPGRQGRPWSTTKMIINSNK